VTIMDNGFVITTAVVGVAVLGLVTTTFSFRGPLYNASYMVCDHSIGGCSTRLRYLLYLLGRHRWLVDWKPCSRCRCKPDNGELGQRSSGPWFFPSCGRWNKRCDTTACSGGCMSRTGTTSLARRRSVLILGTPGSANPHVYLDSVENTLAVLVNVMSGASGSSGSTVPAPVGSDGSAAVDDRFTCKVKNIPLQTWFSVSIS